MASVASACGSRYWYVIAVGVCAMCLATAGAASATASTSARRVCRTSVALHDSPAGFTVGYLLRGDRVRLLPSANRTWARVDTPLRVRGWVPRRALCSR